MTTATLLLALIVTTAADNSGKDPILLDFHASWCGPCRTMRPVVKKLVENRYPVRSVDIDRDREMTDRYHVEVVPTFIVVDPQGRVLARASGPMAPAQLASLYNDAKIKFASDESAESLASIDEETRFDAHRDTSTDEAEDAPKRPGEMDGPEASNPKPWETVVRIKMHLSDREWGFGSGTIIYSSAEESIILTCAHIFRIKGSSQPSPKNFRVPITVDLFDGQIRDSRRPVLACVEKDIRGEAIDYDFDNDVGLIRIRPGRVLPASRVVSDTWKPKSGMPMYSVGCSHGNDATPWTTRILDPLVEMSNTSNHKRFYEMKCDFQPMEGRSGGGLYTSDGFVAGVCDFADPNEKVGLYAVPAAIHRILDKNLMTAFYKKSIDGLDRAYAATRQRKPGVASGMIARAQSPSDPDQQYSTETADFTIPAPGMFKIAAPGTRTLVNQPRPGYRGESPVLADSIAARRVNHKPDRAGIEVIDPGADIQLADQSMSPPDDSRLYQRSGPAPEASEAITTPERVVGNRSVKSWKPVRTARSDDHDRVRTSP